MSHDLPNHDDDQAGRAYYYGALAMLFVLGLVVGLFTALQATRLVLFGPLHVSVGGVAALVVNAGLGAGAAWALRSRDAALLPGAGWFVAVLALLMLPRPGGDVVLPDGGGAVIAFMLLGIVGAIAGRLIATRVAPPASPGGAARR